MIQTINDETAMSEMPSKNFVTDASAIGLPPGEWPNELKTSLGNGRNLIRSYYERDERGNITACVYRQGCSLLTITVLNT